MKNLKHLAIISSAMLIYSCGSKPCPECPPTTEEKLEDVQPDFSYEGWYVTGDDTTKAVAESVIVFSPIYPSDGTYLEYGTKHGYHDICTDFVAGATQTDPSQVKLTIGEYYKNILRMDKNAPLVKLDDDPDNPVTIEWFIDTKRRLMFRVGKVNKTYTSSPDAAIPFDKDGAIKLTGSFPKALGVSVPALIGADDARGGNYTKDKVISYTDNVKGKCYASLFYVSKDDDEGMLYQSVVENVKTIKTSASTVGVNTWECQ